MATDIPAKIKRLEDFSNSTGSFRGINMTGASHLKYSTDLAKVQYVVMSYTTVIGVYTHGIGWKTFPAYVRLSLTSKRHLDKLVSAIEDCGLSADVTSYLERYGLHPVTKDRNV